MFIYGEYQCIRVNILYIRLYEDSYIMNFCTYIYYDYFIHTYINIKEYI